MKPKNILLISVSLILIILILGLIIYFGIIRQSIIGTFEYGYKPYGESPNSITGLLFNTQTIAYPHPTKRYSTSKYWDIYESITYIPSFDISIVEGMFNKNSNDFYIYKEGLDITQTIQFTTTEYFDERNFKVDINQRSHTLNAGRLAESTFHLLFVDEDNQETSIFTNTVQSSKEVENTLLIKPSPISDTVTIYWNGKKVQEIKYDKKYKIKLSFNTGNPSGHQAGGSDYKIINPSWKSQFGCDKAPSEQYYVKIFNEGQKIYLNKLENFQRFCLEESPLKIYSNIGSTTNEEVLLGLVEDKDYQIPDGQIWTIEYMGDIVNPETTCEKSKVYNLNEKVCMARTLISLQCSEGSKIDLKKGYCVVETKPTIYNYPEIKTHQDLEKDSKFLFVDIFNEDNEIRKNTIQIGKDTFTSSLSGDKDNNIASISYLKDYNLKEGDIQELDKYLSIKVNNINSNYNLDNSIDNYKIEYLFILDTSFINLSYIKSINSITTIKIINSYKDFEGGYIITKIDNVGKTIIESINKEIKKGENILELNITNNIEEVKIRPFISIKTPNYDYKIDTQKALVFEIEKEEVNIINDLPLIEKTKESKLDGWIIILIILGGVFLLIFLILIIYLLKRSK